MADTSKLNFSLLYTPGVVGVAPIAYSSLIAQPGVAPTQYQLIECAPITGTPFVVTPAFVVSITSFFYVNLDPAVTVTITVAPLGQVAGATNTFVVAANGGWMGGTISLAKAAAFTITTTSATISSGLLYISGT